MLTCTQRLFGIMDKDRGFLATVTVDIFVHWLKDDLNHMKRLLEDNVRPSVQKLRLLDYNEKCLQKLISHKEAMLVFKVSEHYIHVVSFLLKSNKLLSTKKIQVRFTYLLMPIFV